MLMFTTRRCAAFMFAAAFSAGASAAPPDPVCIDMEDGAISCFVEVKVKGRSYIRRYGTEGQDYLVRTDGVMGARAKRAAEELREVNLELNEVLASKGLPLEELPSLPVPPPASSVRCPDGPLDICYPVYAGKKKAKPAPAAKSSTRSSGMRLTDRQCLGEGAYRVCTETYQDGKGNLHIRSSDSMGNVYSTSTESEVRPDGSSRIRSYDTEGNAYEVRSWSDSQGIHSVDSEGNRCTITPTGRMIGCN